MSLRKNLYRLGFLALGFVLTLVYFNAPGPRTSTPPPHKLHKIAQSEQVSELPESDRELLLMEEELAAKLGSEFSQGAHLNVQLNMQLNERLNDAQSIAAQSVNQDKPATEVLDLTELSESEILEQERASFSFSVPKTQDPQTQDPQTQDPQTQDLQPKQLQDTDQRGVIFYGSTGKVGYGSLALPETENLELQDLDQTAETAKALVPALEAPEKLAPQVKTEIVKPVAKVSQKPVVSTKAVAPSRAAQSRPVQKPLPAKIFTPELSKAMLENVERRERILTTKLLMPEQSNKEVVKPVVPLSVQKDSEPYPVYYSESYIESRSEANCQAECKADLEKVFTSTVTTSASTILGNVAVAVDKAGVRAGPSMNYILVTVLKRGEIVQVNYSQGDWINVDTESGIHAWLPREYLAVN